MRPKEYTEIHKRLLNILEKYGQEYGDSIIDEICELFGAELTPEEDN